MELPTVRLLVAVAGIAALALCQTAIADLTFTRERFDEMDRHMDSLRDIPNAGPDAFAWGEGYMIRGYIEMYRATGDRDYLRSIVRVSDAILDTRPILPDGSRQPVWDVAGKYAVATRTLKDTEGRDTILLRSIRYAYNDQTLVEVLPGDAEGTFTLKTSNEFWKERATATFENLSLDPDSPRYFPRIINEPNYVAYENFTRSDDPDATPSFVLVALDLRKNPRKATVLAPAPAASLVPKSIRYYGYIGPIFGPMTRFAKLVHDCPELQPEFQAAADRCLKAATEAVDSWEFCWRDGPNEDEGYYLLTEKGAAMWCDGIMAPFNYLGAMGQVLLNLWDCTGDTRALDHARRMARLFKRSCTVLPNGSYSFAYWSPVGYDGWTKPQRLSANTPAYPGTKSAEDMSHGALEVQFAVMCWQHKIVFTRSDMRRFAKTFTKNLWTGDPKDLALRVDGSGGPAGGNNVSGARWLDLCELEPEIFEMNRAVWEANDYASGVYGNLTGAYARLFRWQEERQEGRQE